LEIIIDTAVKTFLRPQKVDCL